MANMNELVNNKEFLLELSKQKTGHEAKELFEKYGVTLSDSEYAELVRAQNMVVDMGKANGELTEQDLTNVSGGFGIISAIIGGAIMAGSILGTAHGLKHVANEVSCGMTGEQAWEGSHWACD
ncbi:MAG: class IIb bacteriocin, lactobin A/cerein 7B family [Oscillospiraceae bacterium]|nr:class IIb bacteriocin, lactobin A/cerein 7B family [Oscillospiraceae bacterium]